MWGALKGVRMNSKKAAVGRREREKRVKVRVTNQERKENTDEAGGGLERLLEEEEGCDGEGGFSFWNLPNK